MLSTPIEVTVNILYFQAIEPTTRIILTVFTCRNREGFLFPVLLTEQILLIPNFFFLNQHLGRRIVPGSINSASLQTELLS